MENKEQVLKRENEVYYKEFFTGKYFQFVRMVIKYYNVPT